MHQQASTAALYDNVGRPWGPTDDDPPALEGSAGRSRSRPEELPTY